MTNEQKRKFKRLLKPIVESVINEQGDIHWMKAFFKSMDEWATTKTELTDEDKAWLKGKLMRAIKQWA